MWHTGSRGARWGDADAGWPGLPSHSPCAGKRQAEQETAAAWSLPMAAVGDGSVTHEARSGGGPGEGFLVDTGWCNGRWVCRKFQMLEDLPDDLTVRDGGDEAQRPPLAPGAARPIQRKDALEQPRPAPARRSRVGLLLVYTLLAWRRDDGAAQVAVGRQTAAIAHQVDARQGHERRQLLQEFHWGEPHARGAVRPRVDEGVEEIAVGVLRQALQRHGTSSSIADQALQLISLVRGDLGIRVQGKPVDAGTAGTAQERALTLAAKPSADVPDMLASPLPKSNALLHRSRQGTGEFGSVVVQGIIACGHSRIEACLQVSQVVQLMDDSPTDFLDHGGDVRVGRWLTLHKPELEARLGAIEVDTLQEDAMEMEVQIDDTAKTLPLGGMHCWGGSVKGRLYFLSIARKRFEGHLQCLFVLVTLEARPCLFSSRYTSIMRQSVDTTLGKFVDHLIRGFTPEVAKYFAELPKPNPEFQARLDELAEKANEGTLSPEEAKEYDKYVEYMDFIALIRLKARLRVSTLPNV
jgi:hypothetical protein